MVAQIVVTDGQTRHECVKMKDWENHLEPIPALAFEGQPFLYIGMYTEGTAGPHNVALVSASGDNFGRALKIKMLCREFCVATIVLLICLLFMLSMYRHIASLELKRVRK